MSYSKNPEPRPRLESLGPELTNAELCWLLAGAAFYTLLLFGGITSC